MPAIDKIALLAALTQEESFRPFVYDDTTGKNLVRGMVIHGNPTLAVGWNIAARPCTYELGQIILSYFVDQTWDDVKRAIPWAASLPEPCQRAICDMAFNVGVSDLLGFTVFLALLQQGKYDDAANDLATTLWFEQVKSRGPKIQALIRQGAIQGA